MRLGDYLASRLECLKKYGVVREVRGKGVLRGVELVKDTRGMQPFPELGKAMKSTALAERHYHARRSVLVRRLPAADRR